MLFRKLKENKTAVIFLVIMLVAIFLRTYAHSDLLRFGKDQVRDAKKIQNIIEKDEPLPLIGPQSGGTFYLGPIFYYFQYASAKIFGTSPDKMAYPDLLFSLLTIPLIYFFLKKYFSGAISISLSALYAVSFFAVQNGRFAWNPNSLPFFSMLFLYAFLELIDPRAQKKIIWAAIAGVALGVGVQLHALYLFVIPTVLIVFSIYLIRKKLLSAKSVIVILFVALLLNTPQIISEVKTGGQNIKAFFSGIGQKSVEKNTFPKNLFVASLWNIQANTLFILPLGSDTELHLPDAINSARHNKEGIEGFGEDLPLWLRVIFGMALSLGGYYLIWYYLKREDDVQKKIFLKIMAFYIIFSFLLLIPLSHILVLRYLLILQFIPFLLLGLIMKFVQEKFSKEAYLVAFVLIFAFSALNIYLVICEYRSFLRGKGDIGIAIWSEQKVLGDFILAHSSPDQKLWFVFEPLNAHKFIRPLAYFRDDIGFSLFANDSTPLEEENVAYFTLILDRDKEEKTFKKSFEKSGQYEISDSVVHGRFKIFKLILKYD